MNLFLIQLILIAPTILEAYVIDPLFWWKGHDDKPWSTYIRAALVIISGIVVQLIGDNWALAGMLVAAAYHFAIFPYMINGVLGKRWDYLGGSLFDKAFARIPPYGRVFFQAVALGAALLAYLYFNSTIYQDSTILFDLPKYR